MSLSKLIGKIGMKSILFSLFLLYTEAAAIVDRCPKQCECESQMDNTAAVYCNRGSIDDSSFYRILETAPDRTSLLEIRGSSKKPNNFR